jgi:hypothetical protein
MTHAEGRAQVESERITGESPEQAGGEKTAQTRTMAAAKSPMPAAMVQRKRSGQ